MFTYISVLDDEYGTDYLKFEPETLKSELNPSDMAFDKIMAGITLRVTSSFWYDITSFEKIALAINSRPVSFEEYQSLSPAEITYAVVEAAMIDKPVPFSEDISIYISKILYDAGYAVAPDYIEHYYSNNKRFSRGINKKLHDMTKKSVGNDEKIQTAKLDMIEEYIKQQLASLITELNTYR